MLASRSTRQVVGLLQDCGDKPASMDRVEKQSTSVQESTPTLSTGRHFHPHPRKPIRIAARRSSYTPYPLVSFSMQDSAFQHHLRGHPRYLYRPGAKKPRLWASSGQPSANSTIPTIFLQQKQLQDSFSNSNCYKRLSANLSSTSFASRDSHRKDAAACAERRDCYSAADLVDAAGGPVFAGIPGDTG